MTAAAMVFEIATTVHREEADLADADPSGIPGMEGEPEELIKLRRSSERILRAQDKTNDLLADILKELRRR